MTRRFQFSLRTLLVATAVPAIALGSWCHRIKSQNAVLAWIESTDGVVMYRHKDGGGGSYSDSPPWLRILDGYRVEDIVLDGSQVDDDHLLTLVVFPRLETVIISGDTKVTREGIASLKRLLPGCVVHASHAIGK